MLSRAGILYYSCVWNFICPYLCVEVRKTACSCLEGEVYFSWRNSACEYEIYLACDTSYSPIPMTREIHAHSSNTRDVMIFGWTYNIWHVCSVSAQPTVLLKARRCGAITATRAASVARLICERGQKDLMETRPAWLELICHASLLRVLTRPGNGQRRGYKGRKVSCVEDGRS